MNQKELEVLYNNTPYNIYLVCSWAKYGVLPCKWTGRYIDENESIPEIIEYNDCNGTRDLFYTCPIYRASTEATSWWFFDEEQARDLARNLNGEFARFYCSTHEELKELDKTYDKSSVRCNRAEKRTDVSDTMEYVSLE